ncbi:MAG TPA: prolyl oligopeptidase family serine peptidase, partial [Dongiaceae bacterium]|nr:prolyl oligopeptidase family serine peptidase [Dongiaceae bacterium]
EGVRYGFSGAPLFLMGHSAGAHIACLLALDERYRALAHLDVSQIRGVIGLSGVYRFRPENSPLHSAIFASAGPDFETVKPINYVGAHQVPLLLLHGRNDTLVGYKTAQRMFDAATAAGQKVKLHPQDGYGHVRPLFDFLPFMPNHQKTMALLLTFMMEHRA